MRQAYLEYHHTLEKRIIKIDELVNLTRQELQLLQTDTGNVGNFVYSKLCTAIAMNIASCDIVDV